MWRLGSRKGCNFFFAQPADGLRKERAFKTQMIRQRQVEIERGADKTIAARAVDQEAAWPSTHPAPGSKLDLIHFIPADPEVERVSLAGRAPALPVEITEAIPGRLLGRGVRAGNCQKA